MIKASWKRRPEVLIKRIQRAEKKLLSGVKDASGTLARTIRRDLAKRVRVAKTVSRQDHPSGNRVNIPSIEPFRVELATSSKQAVVKVDLRSHYVAARTKGVTGALRYLGMLVAATFRKGLWVVPGKRRGTRARNSNGPAKFVSFAANAGLRRWAADPAKGQQNRRHALLLNAKMMQALLMGPTLRKNAKKARAAWRALVREWSKS